MAYGSVFPAGYQPMYYPQYQPQQQVQMPSQAQQTPNSGIIWVQGEAGAKSYLVAPNTTVQLWDSESQTIYLKSADASGMPSIKALDYTVREANQSQTIPPAPMNDYATKEDIRSLHDEIEELRSRMSVRIAKVRKDGEDG